MQFLGKMLTMYPNESKVQDVTDSMSLTLRAWVFSFYFIGCIFILYPCNYYNVLITLGFFFCLFKHDHAGTFYNYCNNLSF